MESQYYSPSILAIVIGFIILVIALFGCVGAIKESTCLVNTYSFFLAIVLVLEIAVSIAAYAMRANLNATIGNNMEVAMHHYDNEFNAFTWNATQYNLQCCGINEATEWNRFAGFSGYYLTNATYRNETVNVPLTCCPDENCERYKVYEYGCLNRLTFIVSQCALLLGVGALCVSFIQLMGIIFAHMLAKSIRKLKTQIIVDKEERRRHFYEQMTKSEIDEPSKKSPILFTTSSEA
ncbi:CD63 antigen-like isoform X2 [Cylas formicarius]|nr:CD63 antigen-like isoform X2 [Cylas formicarius]XP_060529659.1 CD63 antigen-like isoform X2 [Cylas formicarius]